MLGGAVSGGILVGALLLAVAHVNAEPQNGWWWNPNESGRGFFIEMTGGLMFLAGYFYESDGRATWLSSGGPGRDVKRTSAPSTAALALSAQRAPAAT